MPADSPGAPTAQSKIVVDAICKSFDTDAGELAVVDGISFAVNEGETVAIVGPSGCGKSTLLGMLAGFLPPDRGSVRIDGVKRRGPSHKGVVISQQGSVFPWLTVQLNVMFGINNLAREAKAEIARHYLELVGLSGFENSYPHELSGGMLKRVEIARALAVKPEILYMDEPFSALDALMSLRMRHELRRILEKERQTVVLITHDVEEAIHLADRVLVLSPRPTKIQACFDVPFAHPRKLGSSEAQALKGTILAELGLSV